MKKLILMTIVMLLVAGLTGCGKKDTVTTTLTQTDLQSNFPDTVNENQNNDSPLPFRFDIKNMICDSEVKDSLRKCNLGMWVTTSTEMTGYDIFQKYMGYYGEHGLKLEVLTIEGSVYSLEHYTPAEANINETIHFKIPTGIPLSAFSYTDNPAWGFTFYFSFNYKETPEAIEISAPGYKTQEIKIPNYIPGEIYSNPETPQMLAKVEKFSKSVNDLNFVKLNDALEIATFQPVYTLNENGRHLIYLPIKIKNIDTINDFSFSLNTALISSDGTVWSNERWSDMCIDTNEIKIKGGEEFTSSICFTRMQGNYYDPSFTYYFWVQPSDSMSTPGIVFNSNEDDKLTSEGAAIPTPLPTAAKEETLSIVPFNYQLNDTGDGWTDGIVSLAFENKSNEPYISKTNYLFPPGLTEDVMIETMEGITYEGHLGSSVSYGYVENILVPPGFRLLGDEDYRIFWKSAKAATPTRVTFPNFPELNFDLPDQQNEILSFPYDSPPSSINTLASLANVFLSNDSAGIVATYTGNCRKPFNVDGNYFDGYYLEMAVENKDKYNERSFTIMLPSVNIFRADGIVESPTSFVYYGDVTSKSNRQWPTITLGPGVSEKGLLEIYGATTIRGTPVLVSFSNKDYWIYDLSSCTDD